MTTADPVVQKQCADALGLRSQVRCQVDLLVLHPREGLSAGRGIEYRSIARPAWIWISLMNRPRRHRVWDTLPAAWINRSGLFVSSSMSWSVGRAAPRSRRRVSRWLP